MTHHERFKKFTIMVVPDDTKDVRHIRIPYLLLPIILLFLVAWGAYLTWFINDYLTIKPQMHRLGRLEDESRRQRVQFIRLAKRLQETKRTLEEIKGKSPELARWEAYKKSAPTFGIGGSYLHLVESNLLIDEQKQEYALYEPTLLASINQNIQRRYRPDALNLSTPGVKGGSDSERTDRDSEGAVKGSKQSIRRKLKAIAMELGLDPHLALSMARVESGFNPKLVSPKGAIGVLQVTPRLAWHDFKVPREKLFDPNVNIRVGLSWMKYLLKRFDHNLELSLAAYNAGVSRVVRAGYKIPRIKETRNYVKRVKRAMKKETEA